MLIWYFFMKKGIRGGIARFTCHYLEVYNKYILNYDKTINYTFSIVILTINIDGFCCNNFLVMDLNLLKIYQWLHEHLPQSNKQ